MKNSLVSFKDKILDRYFETVEEPEAEFETIISTQDSHDKVIENPIKKVETFPQTIEKELPISKGFSVISSGTEIQGNIITSDNLEVNAKVVGDITTTANLTIKDSEVVGNIRGENVFVINSKIQGNIEGAIFVEIHTDSQVNGHLRSQNLTLDSLCKGNIYVENSLVLLRNANVIGDIQTSKIKIDEGAVMHGMVKMKK